MRPRFCAVPLPVIDALARLLTVVEAGGDELHSIAAAIFAAGRGAHTVGLTGSPGAGKSTLTDALVGEILLRDGKAAVVAVDPPRRTAAARSSAIGCA